MSDKVSYKEQLSVNFTKETAKYIASEIGLHNDRLPELMSLFFDDDDIRIAQRSAWAVGMLATNYADLLVPYLEEMLEHLKKPHHDTVIRNTFRTFQFIDFPEELEGRVFDIALDHLMDINHAIAIRVFAMTVCGNIASKYPELNVELIPVIEEHLPHGSAGFRARGAAVLKQLRSKSIT